MGNELLEQIKKLGENIAEKLEKTNARIDAAEKKSFAKIDIPESEKKSISFTKMIRFLANPTSGVDIGFEKEVSQELAKKTGKSCDGKFLVPLEMKSGFLYSGTGSEVVQTDILSKEFVDVLRAKSLILKLGARQLTGLTGNVSIPKLGTSATAYWVTGDGENLTESTPVLSNVSLEPHTLGGLVSYSHRLLIQSDPSIEEIIRNDLAATLAVELDRAAIRGDGTGSAPTGILNTSGIGSATYTNGGAPTWSDIVDLEGTIDSENALNGSLAYLTTPTMLSTLKTTAKESGQPEYIAEDGMMNGYKVYSTSNVPSGYLLFGNFNELLVGFWGTLELMADPYSSFASGSVSVRAMLDVDFALRHGESFSEIHEAST